MFVSSSKLFHLNSHIFTLFSISDFTFSVFVSWAEDYLILVFKSDTSMTSGSKLCVNYDILEVD